MDTPGAIGFTDRNRPGIFVVSKRQFSLSPSKTDMIFSSSGRTRSVDCSTLVLMVTVAFSFTRSVRASRAVAEFGGAGCPGAALKN